MKEFGVVLSAIALLIGLSACTVDPFSHKANTDAVLLNARQAKNFTIVLVGDSTMATGSGYGDRFCAASFLM